MKYCHTNFVATNTLLSAIDVLHTTNRNNGGGKECRLTWSDHDHKVILMKSTLRLTFVLYSL